MKFSSHTLGWFLLKPFLIAFFKIFSMSSMPPPYVKQVAERAHV